MGVKITSFSKKESGIGNIIIPQSEELSKFVYFHFLLTKCYL